MSYPINDIRTLCKVTVELLCSACWVPRSVRQKPYRCRAENGPSKGNAEVNRVIIADGTRGSYRKMA
jgi:hypothetical protein